MLIRPVNASDAAEWLRLRMALWTDSEVGSEKAEIDHFLAVPSRPPLPFLHAAFVCERPGQGLCGLAEASVRPYVDGCETSNVAYLEAWYVDADSRGLGIGRALAEAVERWGLEQGCQEIASDAELSNSLSQAVHQKIGFVEVGRVVQFCKPLIPDQLAAASD